MARADQDPVGAPGGHRVLIVEDEMLVAMELESVLTRQGWVPLGPSPTVARALELLVNERPDAAILDLNLKGECAAPVAAALKADGVPFVVVSGYARASSRRPELAGATRVDKPIDHRVLVARLGELLAGPERRAEDG